MEERGQDTCLKKRPRSAPKGKCCSLRDVDQHGRHGVAYPTGAPHTAGLTQHQAYTPTTPTCCLAASFIFRSLLSYRRSSSARS